MTQRFTRTALGAALLASAAVSLTGCAGFNAPLAGSDVATEGAYLTGNVHGGRQPIANSTINIYAIGKSGYGSGVTGSLLATTTTDANGNFSFGPASGHSYACPPATSTTLTQNLYITATGGNPNGTGGSTNPNAVLMTVLPGTCANVIATQPSIVINELTTVASMFAMQQFFSPDTTNGGGHFGTSATNLTGLTNAINTAGNLIYLQNGTPAANFTVSGPVTGYTTNPVVTITPEEAKIDTIANIIAACVNTNGASTTSPVTTCGTLFADVASPAVLDTLQATYYLAINPTSTVGTTSNIAAIYNLGTPAAPYQPTLTAAPTDWTLGITYGSSSSQATTGASTFLLTKPENLAIDSTGNVWIDNYASTVTGTVGNSITELSPVGVPLKQIFTGTQLRGSFSVILDPSNNVWATNYGTTTAASGGLGTNVVEYVATTGATNSFATGAGPTAIASDGAGNIFIPTTSASGGAANLESIQAGSATGTAATTVATGLVDSSYSEIGIDSNETIYVSDASTTSKGTTQFLNIPGTNTFSAVTTAVGGQGQVEPIAIDNGNKVWTGSYSSVASNTGQISNINANATGTNFISSTAVTATTDPALNAIQKLALDGAGNIWVASGSTTASGVSEFSNTGAVISPANTNGFAHTFNGVDKVAIDGSGNVWVGNTGTAATATVPAFITEIVGQAVPVVTPIAAGLPVTPGGASRLASKP